MTIKCMALAAIITKRENTGLGDRQIEPSKNPAPSNTVGQSPALEMTDSSMQGRAASAGRDTRLDGRAGILSALPDRRFDGLCAI